MDTFWDAVREAAKEGPSTGLTELELSARPAPVTFGARCRTARGPFTDLTVRARPEHPVWGTGRDTTKRSRGRRLRAEAAQSDSVPAKGMVVQSSQVPSADARPVTVRIGGGAPARTDLSRTPRLWTLAGRASSTPSVVRCVFAGQSGANRSVAAIIRAFIRSDPRWPTPVDDVQLCTGPAPRDVPRDVRRPGQVEPPVAQHRGDAGERSSRPRIASSGWNAAFAEVVRDGPDEPVPEVLVRIPRVGPHPGHGVDLEARDGLLPLAPSRPPRRTAPARSGTRSGGRMRRRGARRARPARAAPPGSAGGPPGSTGPRHG